MTIVAEGSWSIGVLLGIPAAILAVALLLTGWRLAYRQSLKGGYDEKLWLWGSRILFASVFVTIGFTAWAFYPYSVEYHKWKTKEGTVEAISKRIVGSGDSINEKFVVRFAPPIPDNWATSEYGCKDTRCAIVKPGDVLTLKCKRVWQYTGTDGYDCTYVSSRTP